MKAFYLFLLLVITFTFSLSAQSLYLDQNYGNNGIVSLETKGHPFWNRYLNFDSQDRLYINLEYLWWNIFSQDSTENTFKLKRLSPTGELDYNWLYELGEPSSSPEYLNPINNITWVQKDKLINYSALQENGDTQPTARVYSLEGDLLSTIEVSPIRGIAGLYGNRSIVIDEQDHMTLHHNGKLKRYLGTGEIDPSYGIDGTAEVYPDSSNISLYSSIYETSDNSILLSTGWDGQLAKVTSDGQLDKSFGIDGFLKIDQNVFIDDIYFDEKDKYIIIYTKIDVVNSSINSYVRKTNVNGTTELEFPIDNFRNPKNDSLHIFTSRYMVGPDGYGICITTHPSHTVTPDTTIRYNNYYMHRFLPNGDMDLSFGEEGFLSLDSIPCNHLHYNLLDQAYNAYLTSYESTSLQRIENNAHVIKFKASALWPTVSDLPSNTYRFYIYPNPSVDKFILSYEGATLESINVTIFDVQGRLISRKDIPELRNKDEVRITDQFLSAGSYLVKVLDQENRNLHTDKLLVIK